MLFGGSRGRGDGWLRQQAAAGGAGRPACLGSCTLGRGACALCVNSVWPLSNRPSPQGLLCGMTQVIVQKLSDSEVRRGEGSGGRWPDSRERAG